MDADGCTCTHFPRGPHSGVLGCCWNDGDTWVCPCQFRGNNLSEGGVEAVMSNVQHTPGLTWRANLTAILPNGVLRISPVNGAFDLWFYENGEWGTNQYLGNYASEDDAKDYARTWVGDNE